MLKLPANVASLAKLADPTNRRFALAGLLVSERPEGYQVEATDGKRLGIVRGPGAQAERPEALADAPNGATEAIIGAADFAALVKANGKARWPALLVLGYEASTFLTGGKVVRVRNLDGRWPAIDQVLPSTPPAVEFAVTAKLFAELLLVAAAFGDEGNGNVLIRFWDKDKPVATQTANSSGQSFFGLLMPVSGTRLAPPIEPELPGWVEQLIETADDMLQCMRKPNGDRLKTIRLTDCLEEVGRLEVAVKVAKAALADKLPGDRRTAAQEVASDQVFAADPGGAEAPADSDEVEEAADEPAEGDGHQSNGQPR
jgi:hypothetical protein